MMKKHFFSIVFASLLFSFLIIAVSCKKNNGQLQMQELSPEDLYALEEGWIPSSAVKVYSNKLKAEQARKLK